MNLNIAVGTSTMPLWFLVLSLFLPRLCLVLAWLQHNLPAHLPASLNLIQIAVGLLIPRILILFWIYTDQGISLWFLIHAVALVFAWGGGSTRYARRRRVDVLD